MKKTGIAAAFLLILGLTAEAQEKPVLSSKDRPDTVKITVTGEVDLDYVWRREEIVAFTRGVSGTSTPADAASENTLEGFVALRLNAELSDKVSAVLEFGTKRADAGVLSVFAGPSGSGSAALALKLREAHILIQELYLPELQAQIGISTWNFDIRGKGESMAFDPRQSQSFFRNVNPAPDGDTALRMRAGDYQELEPAGLWLRYGREKLVIDLVALPAVIEGGAPHQDEAFYALDLFYKFDDKDSRMGLITSATAGRSGGLIYTYGGGFDWKGTGSFDIYAELYFQNGEGGAGVGPPISVGGYAGQVGVEYAIPGDAKSWIGANLTYYSGDNTANGKSSSFASYENIHDLMILEDMYLGFDWDTNYRAIKISGGFALNAGGKGNLRFSGILGLCQTARAVRFVTIPVPENTHKLGDEADVRADWDFTRQLSFGAGIAYLWGSRVLEDSMGGQGVGNASLHTLLFTVGTDLKF
ncbi:MAG TPA: hypothetical protein VMU54_13960 [Planctomycetota bacterium]|nr:hypothetical protein [Planctomycetota bacterium]